MCYKPLLMGEQHLADSPFPRKETGAKLVLVLKLVVSQSSAGKEPSSSLLFASRNVTQSTKNGQYAKPTRGVTNQADDQ